MNDLATMRREYVRIGLSRADLAETWLAQFQAWLRDTAAAGLPEPNAMVLATADPSGRPSARTVLLKGLDERGFTFYTNLASRKGTELAANPYASLVFPWHGLSRQVVVAGRVEPVDRADTEAYFATRPRDSQYGAWASPQSQVVADRTELEAALAEVMGRFEDQAPPAPPNWGGLRVVPETVEFWQGRVGRLHDRLRFRKLAPETGEDSRRTEVGWVIERLAP